MNHSHPALATIVGILTAVVAVCVFLVAANYWSFWPYDNPSGVACTMEAKMCPDGSSVGRSGPKCEFAPCPEGVVYTNSQYGLRVALPSSWKGYAISTQARQVEAGDAQSSAVGWTYIQLSLSHPLSTAQHPRQDIPIMIFTPAQWQNVLSGAFSVSAAPIPPSELARNSHYVFALPARYNYAFLEGFEEVERIIASKSVTAF
jgi:hypothetical protein